MIMIMMVIIMLMMIIKIAIPMIVLMLYDNDDNSIDKIMMMIKRIVIIIKIMIDIIMINIKMKMIITQPNYSYQYHQQRQWQSSIRTTNQIAGRFEPANHRPRPTIRPISVRVAFVPQTSSRRNTMQIKVFLAGKITRHGQNMCVISCSCVCVGAHVCVQMRVSGVCV